MKDGSSSTLKAVHLSDIHLDDTYKVGTLVDCGMDETGCCREAYGYPKKGQQGAREWGEYDCDTPEKTVENTLDYIANVVKPDILFWTGDNSPHDTWEQSNELVANYTIKLTQMIKDKFASTGTTIVPIQGNHDTWPVDLESFEAPGANVPINHFKQYWSDWLDE